MMAQDIPAKIAEQLFMAGCVSVPMARMLMLLRAFRSNLYHDNVLLIIMWRLLGDLPCIHPSSPATVWK